MVTVAANQAGNANYTAAATVDQSFSIAAAGQTISFATLANQTYGAAPFSVSANASSGLAVTFSIVAGGQYASISGNTITILAATPAGAVVTVAADQAGDANYTSAATVDQSFSIAAASQTISFATLANQTYGATPFSVSSNASSGMAVTFSIVAGSQYASISGDTITILGATPAGAVVTVAADQAGDANYTAAATVDQSFTIAAASQTIDFPVSDPVPYGSMPITLPAFGGGSGNPVTLSVVSGPGTLNGNTLTFTGIGSIVVEADQAGNANYFSAAPVQRTIVVTSTYQITSSEYENGTPATIGISVLLGNHYGDPDGSANAKPGIAVFQIAGNGTWQYSSNGATWTAISNVSQTQALLLPESDSVRFTPATNWSGQANLFFVGWNNSQGTAGSFFNIANTGGATPFSTVAANLVVTANPVPLWIGSGATLTSITSNTSSPTGNSVTSVFGNYFHDDNSAISVGVAIVGASGTAGGTWEYSTDGTNWTSFGAATTTLGILSASNALLLSVNDQIRFVPNAGFAGTATLQAYAWDGTQGTAAVFGATKGYKITATGDASGFSTTLLTASCLVNDAPTLGVTTGPTLPAATEGVASSAAVSTLIHDAQFSDPDAHALQGIAILGVGGTGEWLGSWQYSLNGVSWTNLSSVSESSAFLLPSTASLRFVSTVQLDSAVTVNSTTLTYRAWDQTAGKAGSLFAVTATGGATSISSTEVTASLPVNFVNHAPAWVGTGVSFPAELPGITPAGSSVASVFGAYFNDVDGNSVGVAIVGATGTAGGTWEYSTGGTNWTSFGAATTTLGILSASNALLLSVNDQIRFVPNAGFAGTATLQAYAWDGTQGTAALFGATKGYKIAATGSASGFSTTLLAASCLVNDAPTLGATTGPTLLAATEGVVSTVAVSTLIKDAQVSDVDAKALQGIAIVGLGGSGEWPGSWQYSLNGVTWTSLPSVSESSAFLLPSTASLRFLSTVQLDSRDDG